MVVCVGLMIVFVVLVGLCCWVIIWLFIWLIECCCCVLGFGGFYCCLNLVGLVVVWTDYLVGVGFCWLLICLFLACLYDCFGFEVLLFVLVYWFVLTLADCL